MVMGINRCRPMHMDLGVLVQMSFLIFSLSGFRQLSQRRISRGGRAGNSRRGESKEGREVHGHNIYTYIELTTQRSTPLPLLEDQLKMQVCTMSLVH